MLALQPLAQKTAFGNRKLTSEEIQARQEEAEYNKTRRELLEQKENFEELAESDSFKFSKPAKKIFEVGVITTTGLVGGMATGWGAKKSFEGVSKLLKTTPMQKFKAHLKATKKFIIDTAKTIKEKFLKSEAYQMPAKAIKKQYEKFAKSKIGEPIVRFFSSVKKGVVSVYNKIKNSVTFVINKINGVKKETYKNAAINTIGVSGGIASGVTAMKEKSEAKDKE